MYPPAPDFPPQIARKESNPLGIVALTISIIGFICACIPGILIVGWILLPIGFILGIVAAVLKNKMTWPGVSAIIVSVTGTIIGVLVFLFVLESAFVDTLTVDAPVPPRQTTTAAEQTPKSQENNSDSSATTPGEKETAANSQSSSTASSTPAPKKEPRLGTRENPYPFGTPLSSDEWEVTINSVDLDATETLLYAEEYYNLPPDPGHTYILINATVTYVGNDPNGVMPLMRVEFVTPEGNTYDSSNSMVTPPDDLHRASTLYSGASVTGNIALTIPDEELERGVLAVQPDGFHHKAFIAVK